MKPQVAVSPGGSVYWLTGNSVYRGAPSANASLSSFNGMNVSIRAIAADPQYRVWVTGIRFIGSYQEGQDQQVYVAKLGTRTLQTECPGCIAWSTTWGGSENDEGDAITVTPQGVAYVAGGTMSGDLPNVAGGLSGYSDAFYARFSTSQTSPLSARRIGGSGADRAYSIATRQMTAFGSTWTEAYVGGTTSSSSLPNQSSQFPCGGSSRQFIWASGMLVSTNAWSACLGGSWSETMAGIAASAGRIHVAGTTSSLNYYPITNAPQAAFAGGSSDGFVTVMRD